MLVERHLERLNLPKTANILDVGCGTGGTTQFLAKYGRVTGIDFSKDALEFANRKKMDGVAFIEADANKIASQFEPESFDLITFFNVLYHKWIVDDVEVLKQVRTLLRPGGYVLLTEPAFKVLFRNHDIIDSAKTRYQLSDFKTFFKKADLNYKTGHYFGTIAFPIALIMAIRDKFGTKEFENENIAEMNLPSPAINDSLKNIFYLESRFNMFLPIPFGLTLLAIGQRKPK